MALSHSAQIVLQIWPKFQLTDTPGGYSLISHISMYRPKGFLHRFGLETGIVFEGTTGRECMNVFIVSVPNEWERKRNMPFCWRSNLSNDDNFFEARSEYRYEK